MKTQKISSQFAHLNILSQFHLALFIVDKKDKVSNIVEKPIKKYLINAGIYVIRS